MVRSGSVSSAESSAFSGKVLRSVVACGRSVSVIASDVVASGVVSVVSAWLRVPVVKGRSGSVAVGR